MECYLFESDFVPPASGFFSAAFRIAPAAFGSKLSGQVVSSSCKEEVPERLRARVADALQLLLEQPDS